MGHAEIKISFRRPGRQEVIGFPGDLAGTVPDCLECRGSVDVREASRCPRLEAPYHEQNAQLLAEATCQWEENAHPIEMGKATHVEWKRQLEQSQRYLDCAEAALERFATRILRWEKLTTRFEAALATLERTEN